MMIVLSLTSLYRTIAHYNQISSYNEDIFIAAKQVSQYVIGTSYEDVGESYTYYDFDQEEMTFELDHNRLVKTPGFEILLTHVDRLSFEIEDNNIYMNIERDEKEYHFLINYAKEKEEAVDDEVEEIE